MSQERRDGPRGKVFRASVWSTRDRRLIRKSFPTRAAAKAWRADAQTALNEGRIRAPSARTLHEAVEEWLEGAREGSIPNRSGDPYKPSVLRGYERNFKLKVLPELGGKRLSDIHRGDIQRFIEILMGERHAASTIHNAVIPLRAIFRREVEQGRLAVNPTSGLKLPAVRLTRDRAADPAEAVMLLAALPADQRALWATALYGGLRRGELQALDWSNVDLATGVIRVERSWDHQARFVAPKSSHGTRKVPIAAALRDYLVEHRMRQDCAEGLVFGKSAAVPFDPGTAVRKADNAWKAAKLERITMHEARHTFASYMIAAGVNAKALSTYMGHANINITLDRYGHLMPGNEDEAASLLDAYLERANAQARLAQVGGSV